MIKIKLKASEKIKILAKREKMTLQELAVRIGISRQSLHKKMAKNNFTEDEITEIARILGIEIVCVFRYPDGTEI